MTGKLNNARNSRVIKILKKSTKSSKNTYAVSKQAVPHGHSEWNQT